MIYDRHRVYWKNHFLPEEQICNYLVISLNTSMVSEKNPNAKDSLDDVAAKGQRILASWWLLETLDIWIICLPRVAPASHTQPCVLVLAMVGRERGEYARHRHSLRWLGFLGDLLQHPLSSNPTPIQPYHPTTTLPINAIICDTEESAESAYWIPNWW